MSMLGNDPDSLAALSIALAALQRSAMGNQEYLDVTLKTILHNHGSRISTMARDMIEAKLSPEAKQEAGRTGL